MLVRDPPQRSQTKAPFDQCGRPPPTWVGWLTAVIGPEFILTAYRVWMRGIDRYQGAGG